MAFYLLQLAVVLLSVVAVLGQREYETINSLTELQMVMRESAAEMLDKEVGQKLNGACSCSKASCGCCTQLKIPKIHLKCKACINMTVLPSEIGFQMTASIDGKVVFKKKVSAKNPPPICFGIPMVKLAKLCIKFYNLSIVGKSVSGCIKVQAKLSNVMVKNLDLGCFKIPSLEEDSIHAVEKLSNRDMQFLSFLTLKNKQSVKSYERVVFN